MTVARHGVWLFASLPLSVLLADGRVLIADGAWKAEDAPLSAEVYDPDTGEFSRTGSMLASHDGGTATLLQDGRVLIVGGASPAELYNPTTGRFTATGSTSIPRTLHTATLLPDGRVLITGGSGSDGSPVVSAELYDPASGAFSPTGNMGHGRYRHSATLLKDGRVLIAGGDTSAELYDPKTGTFTATGSMTCHDDAAAALLPDGRVVVVGDVIPANNEQFAISIYDPATGQFSTVRDNPGCKPGVYNYGVPAVVALDDGKVFFANTDDSSYPAVLVYDPVVRNFTTVGTTSSNVIVIRLGDGRVLIAGGDPPHWECLDPNGCGTPPTPSPEEFEAGRSAEIFVP